jgi:hypothetical protein
MLPAHALCEATTTKPVKTTEKTRENGAIVNSSFFASACKLVAGYGEGMHGGGELSKLLVFRKKITSPKRQNPVRRAFFLTRN